MSVTIGTHPKINRKIGMIKHQRNWKIFKGKDVMIYVV